MANDDSGRGRRPENVTLLFQVARLPLSPTKERCRATRRVANQLRKNCFDQDTVNDCSEDSQKWRIGQRRPQRAERKS